MKLNPRIREELMRRAGEDRRAQSVSCTSCGRVISLKERHAKCKKCRPSNTKYERSERRKFRHHIINRARYNRDVFHHSYRPNFKGFDRRLAKWVQGKERLAALALIFRYVFNPMLFEIANPRDREAFNRAVKLTQMENLFGGLTAKNHHPAQVLGRGVRS